MKQHHLSHNSKVKINQISINRIRKSLQTIKLQMISQKDLKIPHPHSQKPLLHSIRLPFRKSSSRKSRKSRKKIKKIQLMRRISQQQAHHRKSKIQRQHHLQINKIQLKLKLKPHQNSQPKANQMKPPPSPIQPLIIFPTPTQPRLISQR